MGLCLCEEGSGWWCASKPGASEMLTWRATKPGTEELLRLGFPMGLPHSCFMYHPCSFTEGGTLYS